MTLATTTLEDARLLRQRLAADSEGTEFVCRAALLLRDLEWVDGRCPSCSQPKGGHQWQCDLAGALDMLDQLLLPTSIPLSWPNGTND